jgi:hypothetical protein
MACTNAARAAAAIRHSRKRHVQIGPGALDGSRLSNTRQHYGTSDELNDFHRKRICHAAGPICQDRPAAFFFGASTDP